MKMKRQKGDAWYFKSIPQFNSKTFNRTIISTLSSDLSCKKTLERKFSKPIFLHYTKKVFLE
jgi:hypothetical protein